MAIKFWQLEWQGIDFREIAQVSSTRMAGPEFYAAFYAALFRRIGSFDELDSDWRAKKDAVAEFIHGQTIEGMKVLSVGCGLGYIEHRLQGLSKGEIDLHIHEVAPMALRWIVAEWLPDRLHVGLLPQCLRDENAHFDLIYLSAVDYALDDSELVSLLSILREILTHNGRVLLVSASFWERDWRTPFRTVKRIIAAVRERLGMGSRGQLWGWLRSRAEYRALLASAGYIDQVDGFIGQQGPYWIMASRGKSEYKRDLGSE